MSVAKTLPMLGCGGRQVNGKRRLGDWMNEAGISDKPKISETSVAETVPMLASGGDRLTGKGDWMTG